MRIFLFLLMAVPAGASEWAFSGGFANPNPDNGVVAPGKISTEGMSTTVKFFPSAGTNISTGFEYATFVFGNHVHRAPYSLSREGGEAHHFPIIWKFSSADRTGLYAILGFGPAYFPYGKSFTGGVMATLGYAINFRNGFRMGPEATLRHFLLVRNGDGGKDLTVVNPGLMVSRKF